MATDRKGEGGEFCCAIGCNNARLKKSGANKAFFQFPRGRESTEFVSLSFPPSNEHAAHIPNRVEEGTEIKRVAINLKEQFEFIAAELEKHTSNVRSAKIGAGIITAVVGGATAVFGIASVILTGGAALPIVGVVAGVVAAGTGAAGAATSLGAEIIGKIIEKSKLEDAERAWNGFSTAYLAKYNISSSKNATAASSDAQAILMKFLRGDSDKDAQEALKKFKKLPGLSTHGNEEIELTGAVLCLFDAVGLLNLIAGQKNHPGELLRKFISKVVDPVINRGY